MRKFLSFFLVLLSYWSFGQCGNFTNSVTNVTIGPCNGDLVPPTASVCADFNISFTNGNASFNWGYTITNDGVPVTTTFGPINTSQTGSYPDLVCVNVPCGASISYFINAYSNPNGNGSLCSDVTATIITPPFFPPVLPIVLKNFEVFTSDSYAKLFWLTSSESNNDFFTIERSTDGKKFVAVQDIKGAGNSSIELSYEWVDQNFLGGSIYYRLKQTDYDGKYSYSNTIKVRTEIRSETKVYPNPTTQVVTVSAPSHNTLQIMDVFGKSLINQDLSEGLNTIDVVDLPDGILIFKIGDQIQRILKN
jgi:Secretion system C-terminal sorting domain